MRWDRNGGREVRTKNMLYSFLPGFYTQGFSVPFWYVGVSCGIHSLFWGSLLSPPATIPWKLSSTLIFCVPSWRYENDWEWFGLNLKLVPFSYTPLMRLFIQQMFNSVSRTICWEDIGKWIRVPSLMELMFWWRKLFLSQDLAWNSWLSGRDQNGNKT